MIPLAYYGHHAHGMGDWLLSTIARGMIYRSLWSITRGMPTLEIVGLAAVACIAYFAWSNRA